MRGHGNSRRISLRQDGPLICAHNKAVVPTNSPAGGTRINLRMAACALVVQGAASSSASTGPQVIRHLYGLTPAEYRAAALIAQGKSVPQAAAELGVSRNNLKTQLKSIF